MNIKQTIRMSFFLIIFLIITIISLNKITIHKINENETSKTLISKLISIQSSMNKQLANSVLATHPEVLNKIKSVFIQQEQRFKQLKNTINQHRSALSTNYFDSLNKLYANEKMIKDKFVQLYKLENQKLDLIKKLNQYNLLENKLSNLIEENIWKSENIETIKKFINMRYSSKQALLQYKDKKHLDIWSNQTMQLSNEIGQEHFEAYIQTVNNLRTNLLLLQQLNKDERTLIDNSKQSLQASHKLDNDIMREIETEVQNFIESTNTLLFITSFITVLLVIYLALKVYKNVGLTVDEIEGKVQAGLKEIKSLNEEIEVTQKEVVFTMGAIGESRSKETGNHVKRVAEYSKLLALYSGLDEQEAEMLKQASPMHDIGKVAIPDTVLNKPGRFDESERNIMNTHAQLGYDMLKSSNRKLLKTAATIALEHHEKWDGSGYPNGKAGEDIHLYGRITAVADVFDALGSERVYKKAWDDEKIFNLFKQESGKHFDPKLVGIFFTNLDEFLKIRNTFTD